MFCEAESLITNYVYPKIMSKNHCYLVLKTRPMITSANHLISLTFIEFRDQINSYYLIVRTYGQ